MVRQGNDVVILAMGAQVRDAVNAADQLAQKAISAEIVNCRFIKPMDKSYLKSILDRFNQVITVEEGVRSGGFGEGVLSWLSTNGFKGETKIISLPDEYVEHGPRQVLLDKFGINPTGIKSAVSKRTMNLGIGA